MLILICAQNGILYLIVTRDGRVDRVMRFHTSRRLDDNQVHRILINRRDRYVSAVQFNAIIFISPSAVENVKKKIKEIKMSNMTAHKASHFSTFAPSFTGFSACFMTQILWERGKQRQKYH